MVPFVNWRPLHLCAQFLVLSGVVAMVTCAVFLRLSCILKLAVLLLAAALYTYLIETHRSVFQCLI